MSKFKEGIVMCPDCDGSGTRTADQSCDRCKGQGCIKQVGGITLKLSEMEKRSVRAARRLHELEVLRGYSKRQTLKEVHAALVIAMVEHILEEHIEDILEHHNTYSAESEFRLSLNLLRREEAVGLFSWARRARPWLERILDDTRNVLIELDEPTTDAVSDGCASLIQAAKRHIAELEQLLEEVEE